MSVQATWFGPEDAALLGFVHIPDDGNARGAVVLCPPLGQEHIDSYRAMGLAAQQLCAAGLVVVRFDYEGTGDSTGDQLTSDAVERWLNSVVTAVELARATGAPTVSIVGLRMGALFATAAAQRCGRLQSLVLWDPVVNGRAYLRRQSVLYRMSVGNDREDDGVVSIPAAFYAPSAAKSIGALRLSQFSTAVAAQPLLIVTRAGSTPDTYVQGLIDSGVAVQFDIEGQDRLLERPSSHFHIPSRGIGALTTWLAESFPASRTTVVAPEPRVRACVGHTASGASVFEVLHRCGPDGLFAIETTMGHAERSVVIYSPSKEHRVGPARMHVELARALAASSVQTVRFDRRGTGDSGVVAWDELTPMYSVESMVDAGNIMALAQASPANTTLTGLCAGAWMAVMGALTHRVGAVVVLSPIIWALRTRERKTATAQLSIDRTEAENLQRSRRLRIKAVLRRYLPYVLWRWLGRRGITQVPEVALAALLSHGVDVTVLMPPADYRWFVDQRGPEGLRRLQRRNWHPHIVLTDAGDHSLLHRGTRAVAMDTVTQVVARPVDRGDECDPLRSVS